MRGTPTSSMPVELLRSRLTTLARASYHRALRIGLLDERGARRAPVTFIAPVRFLGRPGRTRGVRRTGPGSKGAEEGGS